MTDLDRRMLLGVASVAGIAAMARAAQAGSLNPPAGPVAPTMKPLTDVEPRVAVQSLSGDGSAQYVISQSGSYYLTADIGGASGMAAIRIDASNVTLDLRGFAVLGIPTSGAGITCGVGYDNLTVRDGSVSQCGGDGIGMNGGSTITLINMRATYNAGHGIAVNSNSRLIACVAAYNLQNGVFASQDCILDGVLADNNMQTGIRVFARSSVLNCSASNNAKVGIQLDTNCIARNCVASFNTGTGVATNVGSGIQGTYGCAVHACNVDHNSGNGLSLDTGSRVAHCSASNNALAGFITYSGAIVESCNANQNGGDGIVISSCSLVTQCNAFGNGGSVAGSAGIRSNIGNNRIDGNVSMSNIGTGILSVAGGNTDTTVRNNCISNSVANYNPSTGGTFGGIAANVSTAPAWSNF